MSFVGGITSLEHSILNILRKNNLMDGDIRKQKGGGDDDVTMITKIFDSKYDNVEGAYDDGDKDEGNNNNYVYDANDENGSVELSDEEKLAKIFEANDDDNDDYETNDDNDKNNSTKCDEKVADLFKDTSLNDDTTETNLKSSNRAQKSTPKSTSKRTSVKSNSSTIQLDEADLETLKYLSGGDLEASALDVYTQIQRDIFTNTLSEVSASANENIQGGKSIDNMVEESLQGGKNIDTMVQESLQGGAMSEDDLMEYSDYSDMSFEEEDLNQTSAFESFKPSTLSGGNTYKKPIISKDSFSKYFIRKLH